MSPVSSPPSITQAPDLLGPRAIVAENFELHRLDSIGLIGVIQDFLKALAINDSVRISAETRCAGATRKFQETGLFAATLRITDQPVAPVQPESVQKIYRSSAHTKFITAQLNQRSGHVAPVQRETSGRVVFRDAQPIEQLSALSRDIKLHRCNAKVSQIQRTASRAQCSHVAPVQRRIRRWHAALIELRSKVMARPDAAPTLHRCNVDYSGMAGKCERHKRKGADEISPFPFDAVDSYRRVVMT